jgi:Mn2+/Fe2+ NRAMP family transporter
LYFKENGYEVRYVLGNLGSALIYLAGLMAYLLSYGTFRILGNFSLVFLNLSLRMKTFLNWNLTFKFFFSQFTAILIPCFINLNSFRNSSNKILTISQVLSVHLLIVNVFILLKLIRAAKLIKTKAEEDN